MWAQASGITDIPGRPKAVFDAYADALRGGKAMWIGRESASGEIQELMEQVYNRKYVALLDKRTTLSGKRRSIELGERALAVDPGQRQRATTALTAWVTAAAVDPKAYEVLDVAWRIAGAGSLGLERYVVLVAGDGSPDGARLMDVKEAAGAALQSIVDLPQPRWNNEAERVVGAYRRLPCSTPTHLRAVAIDGKSFIVRQLQPSEDRLDWGDPKKLDVEDLHKTLGTLLGWAQLRSGGRDGSSIADVLIAYGNDAGWIAPVSEYAAGAAARFRGYWETFCQSDVGR